MHEYQGLSDAFFLLLYGAAGLLALVAAVYLLWRRGNAFMQEVATRLARVGGSGTYCLVDCFVTETED